MKKCARVEARLDGIDVDKCLPKGVSECDGDCKNCEEYIEIDE